MEEHLPLDRCREFTVEAGRPDTITADKLEVLRAHGVHRISINPQTMEDEVLRIMRGCGFGDIETVPDTAGIPRVVYGRLYDEI